MALIIDGFIAFGTLAVAILAIWGPWFRSILAPPKLSLTGHTLDGDPFSRTTTARTMMYRLKVINARPWLPAENCRVMLVGLSRRDPSGVFQPVPMPLPIPFRWAPAEFTPPLVTVLKEQILDLGFIAENTDHFVPHLYWMSSNFDAFVRANEGCAFSAPDRGSKFYITHIRRGSGLGWAMEFHT